MAEKIMDATELIDYLRGAPCQKRFLLFSGPQGSGKSTLAKAIRARQTDDFRSFKRLSADRLRKRSPWLSDDAALTAYAARLEKWLSKGLNIVDDNVNSTDGARTKTIVCARAHGYKDIAIVSFEVPLAVCLEQNRERKRPVPEWIVEKVWLHFHERGRPAQTEARIIRITPADQAGRFSVEEQEETAAPGAARERESTFLNSIKRFLNRVFP